MLELLNSLLIGLGGAFVLHMLAAWYAYARRLVVGPPRRVQRGFAPFELMTSGAVPRSGRARVAR